MITEHLLNHAEVKSNANPFPGLRSFEYREKDLFFGREGQSEEMVPKLDKTHFLAVVGTSGSGKSSLVRAGLWPALHGDLMEGAGSDWRIVVMRPGNSPIANLAIALNYPVDLDSQGAEPVCVPTAETVQIEVTLRWADLGLIEAVRQAKLEPKKSILIVVDQFEELFRYARISEDEVYANDAAKFVKLLLEAKQQPNIYIVLTMRSDYLGDCARFLDLPEAINEGQYLIPRMMPEQRRKAITGPVGVRGASISPQLVNQLLMDMGDSPRQLPILQHALMRIWENWRAKGDENAPLDTFHYDECGGWGKTLSRHAEEAYDELADGLSRGIAEKLFKCLTEKGADEKETRRPTELEEICRIADASEAEVAAVINIFRREGRCFLMPSKSGPLTRDTAIDISHESLIGHWQRLKDWVEDEDYSVRFYRLLVDRALPDRKVGPLVGYRLEQAIEWRKRTRPNPAWASRHHVRFNRLPESSPKAKRERDEEIFQCVMGFIDTSEKRRERKERAKEQARQRKERAKEQAHQKKMKQARRYIAILSVFVALILLSAVKFLTMSNQAQEQSRKLDRLNYRTVMNFAYKARESEKFGEANQLLSLNIPTGKEDDLRGFDWYYLWREIHNERTTLKGDPKHSGKVLGVAISTDGNTLATGNEDGSVKLWDAKTGEFVKDLAGHTGAVISVAFLPDGKTLASGSVDETVILWDYATDPKENPQSFYSANESTPEDKKKRAVRSIAFARNGLQAIGWENGSVMIRDGGAKREIWHKHTGPVWSVAFSPDGKRLVSGGDDGMVKLWDVATGKYKDLQWSSKSERILSVTFSSDGTKIAAGTQNGFVRVWDTESRLETACLARRNNSSELTQPCNSPSNASNSPSDASYTGPAISTLIFSDNDTLITGNGDATLRQWKITDKEETWVFKGHSKEVLSIALAPDRKTVVTGSGDATAKLWDISEPRQPIWLNMQGPQVTAIAFFPEEKDKLLVGGRDDGSIVVWATDSRSEVQLLPGNKEEIISVAVATDRTIASWSRDKYVTLWSPTSDGMYEDARKKRNQIPIEGEVTSVAFSRDGKMLATGSRDGTVKLWDTTKEAESKTLPLKHSEPIALVAFSSDGKTLATVDEGHSIEMWNTSTAEKLGTLDLKDGQIEKIGTVAFSPDGTLFASGSSDNTAKLWDVATGELLTTLKGHENAVKFVVFSRNGEMLATLDSDATVKLWDTRSNQPGEAKANWPELATFHSDNENKIQSLAFSPDRMMMAILRKNRVELWLAATREEVAMQSKESRK